MTARGQFIQRAPAPSPIKLTTHTALSGKQPRVIGYSHERFDRSKEAEESEVATMAVALAQPHRRGSDDKRAGEPLYELCLAYRWRDEMYHAGVAYGEIVRQDRAASGFHVPGLVAGEGEARTEQEITASRELARLRRNKADEELRDVMLRAPSVMVSLCYDMLEPSHKNHGLIQNCLWRLAVHLGMVKLGINEGRAA